jgi:hypothetical protein
LFGRNDAGDRARMAEFAANNPFLIRSLRDS